MRLRLSEKEYYGRLRTYPDGETAFPIYKRYIVKLKKYRFLPFWTTILITNDYDFAEKLYNKRKFAIVGKGVA